MKITDIKGLAEAAPRYSINDLKVGDTVVNVRSLKDTTVSVLGKVVETDDESVTVEHTELYGVEMDGFTFHVTKSGEPSGKATVRYDYREVKRVTKVSDKWFVETQI